MIRMDDPRNPRQSPPQHNEIRHPFSSFETRTQIIFNIRVGGSTTEGYVFGVALFTFRQPNMKLVNFCVVVAPDETSFQNPDSR